MSTRRRVARTLLGLLAAAAALGAGALVGLVALGWAGAATDQVISLAWACALASTLLAVAAVQERSDPDDDPRYLYTVVHGLVDEWRR